MITFWLPKEMPIIVSQHRCVKKNFKSWGFMIFSVPEFLKSTIPDIYEGEY